MTGATVSTTETCRTALPGMKKRLRMVNYLVFADLGCVHIAGDAHLKRFAVVFEYPADRGRLRAKLGVLLADLKRHVLVAVDGEGRMPPVDDEYRQNYQQDVNREYYARRFLLVLRLGICSAVCFLSSFCPPVLSQMLDSIIHHASTGASEKPDISELLKSPLSIIVIILTAENVA